MTLFIPEIPAPFLQKLFCNRWAAIAQKTPGIVNRVSNYRNNADNVAILYKTNLCSRLNMMTLSNVTRNKNLTFYCNF